MGHSGQRLLTATEKVWESWARTDDKPQSKRLWTSAWCHWQ